MGSDSIPLWIIFFICVVGGAYFAATESSFSAVNKIKMKALADDGNKKAIGVMHILGKFEKALTTLLVGNNVTKIAGAAVFTMIATDIFREKFNKSEAFLESFAFSVICSVMSTVIIFLFSEMIPKSFANDRSESVSLFFQGSLRFLMKVMKPFSAFFSLISDFSSKLFSKKEAEPSITEDELTEIIETAEEEGVVDEEQGDMLKSALEFAKTTVGDIMTMEKDIDFIRVNATPTEILEAIRNTNHSRLPVKAENSERVVGILRTRTYLIEHKRNPELRLRSLMKSPYLVRKDAKIDDLLTDMRQHKIQVAMVLDDQKQVVGLVTIEDILEELVGEIFDEEDVVDQNFQALGGNKYMINTHMLVGNAYERMGLGKAPRRIAAKPILSFILETLGHLPAEEESFLYENLQYTAKTVVDGRLSEVVVHILDEEDLAALAVSDPSEEVTV
ncbi:MAG: HlyC/CorC family transporter [Clostridia bacterium]|nr:HlyC/CorC family transporter [Clostridia bacterium]MBR2722489.1 HlyC/CorC family transporter [Clostridia bacterium]